MLNLLVILNLASFLAFVIGMINPRLVLVGDNRTRLKSAGVYLGTFVASGFTISVLAPKPIPKATVPVTIIKPKIKVSPASTPQQKVKLLPVPTPQQKATPLPTPTLSSTDVKHISNAFPTICTTRAYLRSSIEAIKSACFYINLYGIKSESVVLLTEQNGEEKVSEWVSEAGFDKVYSEYDPRKHPTRDACVVYADQSALCLKFSEELGETPVLDSFDSNVCNTDAYLPVNGASTALYTVCQYIKTDLIKPESVTVITGKNGDSDSSVLELQAESGFERVMWRDYTLSENTTRDVCIEYVDKSVSCLKFSK